MAYPNEKVGDSKKFLDTDYEISISLKDVPLEIRRLEAGKPLFLTRYE